MLDFLNQTAPAATGGGGGGGGGPAPVDLSRFVRVSAGAASGGASTTTTGAAKKGPLAASAVHQRDSVTRALGGSVGTVAPSPPSSPTRRAADASHRQQDHAAPSRGGAADAATADYVRALHRQQAAIAAKVKEASEARRRSNSVPSSATNRRSTSPSSTHGHHRLGAPAVPVAAGATARAAQARKKSPHALPMYARPTIAAELSRPRASQGLHQQRHVTSKEGQRHGSGSGGGAITTRTDGGGYVRPMRLEDLAALSSAGSGSPPPIFTGAAGSPPASLRSGAAPSSPRTGAMLLRAVEEAEAAARRRTEDLSIGHLEMISDLSRQTSPAAHPPPKRAPQQQHQQRTPEAVRRTPKGFLTAPESRTVAPRPHPACDSDDATAADGGIRAELEAELEQLKALQDTLRQRDAARDDAVARQQAEWERERSELAHALADARQEARAAKHEAASLRAQLRAVCKNMRPPSHLMPGSNSARGNSALDPESMAAL